MPTLPHQHRTIRSLGITAMAFGQDQRGLQCPLRSLGRTRPRPQHRLEGITGELELAAKARTLGQLHRVLRLGRGEVRIGIQRFAQQCQGLAVLLFGNQTGDVLAGVFAQLVGTVGRAQQALVKLVDRQADSTRTYRAAPT